MVNSRPGTHRVNISLSRRNHTVVFEPQNHCKPLWAFLAKNMISDYQKELLAAKPPSEVHVIEISEVHVLHYLEFVGWMTGMTNFVRDFGQTRNEAGLFGFISTLGKLKGWR